MVLLCGRYEGVDERVRQHLATETLSIGDYVLSGGELPALVMLDAIARLVPGVVGDEESVARDSFVGGLLDYPQYTRPAVFAGTRCRRCCCRGTTRRSRAGGGGEALARTLARRPDLLETATLDDDDRAVLRELERGDVVPVRGTAARRLSERTERRFWPRSAVSQAAAQGTPPIRKRSM